MRFAWLLCAFFLLFGVVALAPVIGLPPEHGGLRLTIATALVLLLGSATRALRAGPRALWGSLILGAVAVASIVLGWSLPQSTLLVGGHGLAVALLGWIIWLILRGVFAAPRVDFETIAASLCVYLMLGLLWAILYSLLEILQPGSFRLASPEESIAFGNGKTVNALYYSYVTLTTVGYGDVSPASNPARMLAVLEAMTGQLYLVVLVARLVGLNVAHETTKGRPEGEGTAPEKPDA